MISGLSHITFITSDLDKMSQIVVEVLGGTQVWSNEGEDKRLTPTRFFAAGGLWLAVIEGENLPSRTYNHVAFKTDENGLLRGTDAVKKLGLEILPSRPRVDGEGKSLYFYSHDNHFIELHTGTLEQRLEAYAA